MARGSVVLGGIDGTGEKIRATAGEPTDENRGEEGWMNHGVNRGRSARVPTAQD